VAVSMASLLFSTVAVQSMSAYRAFSDRSYWNTPLERRAPVARHSADIIAFLRSDNDADYIQLAGVGSSWGMPIYWADQSSPTYDVRNTCTFMQPREFGALRIPLGAVPDPTSDAELTVYDLSGGRVYALWRAQFDGTTNTWSACGGAVYYLHSNGLDGRLAASNEPRNFGHRGFAPPTFAVRYDEIQAGRINHVLKIAVDTTKCVHVFPAVGDECGTQSKYAPPEGTVIRIKPSVDLTNLHLSPAALVIARALKRFGAVIGDQTNSSVTLKLENTVAEGRGLLWDGVLQADSLAAISLSDFQVIKRGYKR
jgi:hypothetical protein